MFEGRLPGEARRSGTQDRRDPPRPPALGVRRQALLPGRDERGRRAAARVRDPRADPLRGHAPRAAGTSTPASPTWTSTGCGPRSTSPRRSPGSRDGCSPAPRTPSSAWPSPGPGTTGSTRRGGSPTPTGSSRAASPSCRPRARGGRDPAQRRAGVPIGHPPRTPPPDRPSQHLLGLLGSDHRGLRGDRHRHLPPRRLLGHARHAGGQPDGRPRGDPVRPDVAHRLRRVALVRAAGRATRASRSP